jgi:hypothetical protein
MNRKCKTVSLIAFVALLSAGPAFTQSPSDDATTRAKAAASVAHVYLQLAGGLYVYDAAANGKLTVVKGSPFQTDGTWMEATNGKYLFSSDSYRIHTYAIESNGAIGKQVAEINTRDFDGANCNGTPSESIASGAVLDHTGKSLYVRIFGYGPDNTGGTRPVCTAYQSYQVSTNGKLTFNGASVWQCCTGDDFQNPTFTANDHFVYGVNWGGAAPVIQYFVRKPNGALDNFNGSAEAPPSPPSSTPFGYADWTWQPNLLRTDPSNHVAMMGIFEATTPEGGIANGRQLASFTVGPTGDLVTTNTYADLVTPAIAPLTLNMSPSGDFLAAGGLAPYMQTGGLQVFHFNGAAPITPYSGLLTDAFQVYEIYWDSTNHLFAVGDDNRLYVYTVTASEITQATGSPYSFDGGIVGSGLIVVPKI